MSQRLNPNALEQDPHEVLDYLVDWSDQLDTGDTISTSGWTVTPSGPTLSIQSNTTTTATTFLAGGTSGVDYTLENTITTAGGRTFQGHLLLRIR